MPNALLRRPQFPLYVPDQGYVAEGWKAAVKCWQVDVRSSLVNGRKGESSQLALNGLVGPKAAGPLWSKHISEADMFSRPIKRQLPALSQK